MLLLLYIQIIIITATAICSDNHYYRYCDIFGLLLLLLLLPYVQIIIITVLVLVLVHIRICLRVYTLILLRVAGVGHDLKVFGDHHDHDIVIISSYHRYRLYYRDIGVIYDIGAASARARA